MIATVDDGMVSVKKRKVFLVSDKIYSEYLVWL